MSLKDYDNLHERSTLSLFGDESRSTCTVAEAKEFERERSRRRRRRALWIGIPVVLIILGIAGCYAYRIRAAAEAARLEEEARLANPERQEVREGNPAALFKLVVQGTSEERLNQKALYAFKQALWQKPSEVYLEETLSGDASPKPLEQVMTVNGKTELPLTLADGRVKMIDPTNPMVDFKELINAIEGEWNRTYPDAQHPMSITVPNERPPEEDSSKDRFKDLKLADDPRMVNPKDGE